MRMTVQYGDKCTSMGKVCVWVESLRIGMTSDTDHVTIECRVVRLRNGLFSVSEITEEYEFIKAQ
jgi:hypothetical protein